MSPLPLILTTFFTEIGPNLAQKIVSSNKHFNDYMTSCDIFQP